MQKIGIEKQTIYVVEVFLYGILLTFAGLMVARVLDKTVKKISDKIDEDDKVKKHIITFLHIGLICVCCLIIREIIVYIEDSIVGFTWGDPSKYATVIMGSIMFSNSNTLIDNINSIKKHYNLN